MVDILFSCNTNFTSTNVCLLVGQTIIKLSKTLFSVHDSPQSFTIVCNHPQQSVIVHNSPSPLPCCFTKIGILSHFRLVMLWLEPWTYLNCVCTGARSNHLQIVKLQDHFFHNMYFFSEFSLYIYPNGCLSVLRIKSLKWEKFK